MGRFNLWRGAHFIPMLIKLFTIFVSEVPFFAALLFSAAGTLCWPAAWAYLILFSTGAFWITLRLARRDPALLAERLKSPWQKGQPFWDKFLGRDGRPRTPTRSRRLPGVRRPRPLPADTVDLVSGTRRLSGGGLRGTYKPSFLKDLARFSREMPRAWSAKPLINKYLT